MLVYLVAALALFGGVVAAADAMVVSDEEQLTELLETLTEQSPGARIDGVLSWVDLQQAPLRISERGHSVRFEDGDTELASTLQDVLAPFDAEELDVVQRSVHVDGDQGRVALRVRDQGELYDATFTLRRNGQGWLVTSVRVL